MEVATGVDTAIGAGRGVPLLELLADSSMESLVGVIKEEVEADEVV